jgi:hypothetical protein
LKTAFKEAKRDKSSVGTLVVKDPWLFFFVNRAERKKKIVGVVGRALSLLLTPRA